MAASASLKQLQKSEEYINFIEIINGTYLEQRTSDKIFNYILFNIYKGEYLPGCKINESALAQKFNHSNNFIAREAMERLVHDDWMVRVPNKGVFLKKFSIKDLEEINKIRLLHEQYAVREIAPNINKKQLIPLKELVETLKNLHYYPYQPRREFMSDIKFHVLLIRFTGNKMLERVAVPLVYKDIVLDRMYPPVKPLMAKLIYQHLQEGWLQGEEPASHDQIYSALAAHDAEQAERMIGDHLAYRHKWREAMEELLPKDESVPYSADSNSEVRVS